MRLLIKIVRAIKRRVRIFDCRAKYLLCGRISCKKTGPVWVICERGTDARDNGYAFYRYIRDNHPEIRVYYLIDKSSADYSRVAEHAVAYGSLENYWVVAKADRIISTHCYTALPVKNEKMWQKLGLAGRFYFLQHGITMEKLPYIFGDYTEMQLFCCAARPEYEYVKKYFRHPDGVVKPTGLARYDYLDNSCVKKQILIMPTWRRYIKNKDEFSVSGYFRAWNDILNDEELTEYIEKEDISLVFYPHIEFQPYIGQFRSDCKNVAIADFGHYDVRQLLMESALLVTDYSSVAFDFAYLGKPCIYFQFDNEEYHRNHYRKGYFDFEKNGFGPVVYTGDNLVNEIIKVSEGNFVMPGEYGHRTDEFFLFRDNRNCERIYSAIIEGDSKEVKNEF